MKKGLKKMCGQKTVMDMLKTMPDNGGLSKTAMLLHEKQCEDFEKMNAKIVKIEKDIEELKTNSKLTDEKVDKILLLLTSNTSFNAFFSKLLDVKYFWLWLIIITGLIFGVNFERVIEIFSK